MKKQHKGAIFFRKERKINIFDTFQIKKNQYFCA